MNNHYSFFHQHQHKIYLTLPHCTNLPEYRSSVHSFSQN
jgi:hypothetical protein